MRVKVEGRMLGKKFLEACEVRGGALGQLAVRYGRARSAPARLRIEKRLRSLVPADLVLKLHLSDAGRRGGLQTSDRKSAASRENGARGGRPVAKEMKKPGRRRRGRRLTEDRCG